MDVFVAQASVKRRHDAAPAGKYGGADDIIRGRSAAGEELAIEDDPRNWFVVNFLWMSRRRAPANFRGLYRFFSSHVYLLPLAFYRTGSAIEAAARKCSDKDSACTMRLFSGTTAGLNYDPSFSSAWRSLGCFCERRR